MAQAQTVKAKPRQELVLHEEVDLGFARVSLDVVAPDRQNLLALLVNRDNVRQLEARRLTVFAHILKAGYVEDGVRLEDNVIAVFLIRRLHAFDLVNLLFYVTTTQAERSAF